MARRLLFFFILALGIVSCTQLAVIVTTFSPYTATPQQLAYFYLSLLGTLASLLTILWYGLRSQLAVRSIRPALHVCFRQALLVSAVLVTLSLLQSMEILSLWEGIGIAVSALLIEFFFQADTRQQPV